MKLPKRVIAASPKASFLPSFMPCGSIVRSSSIPWQKTFAATKNAAGKIKSGLDRSISSKVDQLALTYQINTARKNNVASSLSIFLRFFIAVYFLYLILFVISRFSSIRIRLVRIRSAMMPRANDIIAANSRIAPSISDCKCCPRSPET